MHSHSVEEGNGLFVQIPKTQLVQQGRGTYASLTGPHAVESNYNPKLPDTC